MKLGERIHNARKAAGLSQEALGERLGVVSQTVSKWERGESAPDAALLPPLADALGVSLDWLFDRALTDGALEGAFLSWLRPKTEEERTQAMLRLHRRQLELSLGMLDGAINISPMPEKVRYGWLGKADLSFFRSSPEAPASFLFREPGEGWASLFEDSERFRLLWAALGDSETLRAARKILSIPCHGVVAREVLPQMLELTEPERTVPLLERLNLLYFSTLNLDGRETEVCFFTPDPAVLALLTLAKLFFGPKTPEMYVTGGGWHFRPPLYEGPKPDDPRLWYLDADLL